LAVQGGRTIAERVRTLRFLRVRIFSFPFSSFTFLIPNFCLPVSLSSLPELSLLRAFSASQRLCVSALYFSSICVYPACPYLVGDPVGEGAYFLFSIF
jgi:hypothetical protein